MSKQANHIRMAAFTLLFILIAIILSTQLLGTERSVAAYCKTLTEQDDKLADANGDTYSVTFFKNRSSDPDDFAKAFKQLEAASPDEIQADVTTLRKTFETIRDDPAQALTASIGAIGAESAVERWTEDNCEIEL